jgi:hypothetical protein
VKSLYVIGSLRNPQVPLIAEELRKTTGLDVFDDWYGAGESADDYWRDYEKARGHSFTQALEGHSAKNAFSFDKRNLDRCDAAVLICPAGKSGHLELGYALGCGKPGYILLDGDPDRFDLMYLFATKVVSSTDELASLLAPVPTPKQLAVGCKARVVAPNIRNDGEVVTVTRLINDSSSRYVCTARAATWAYDVHYMAHELVPL